MEETPWAAPTQQMFIVSGQTNEQFDVRTLRDRIRTGELAPDDEISVVGTDVWKPASQYPVLTRYFSLVAQKASSTASPMVHASSAVAAPAKSRYFAAIVYPFTSITTLLFMLLGFAAALNALVLPLLFVLASIFSLAIIRTSADGETRAPEVNAVGGFFDWIFDLLRLIAIAFTSCWPIFALVVPWVMGGFSMTMFLIAVVVSLLYYPACLIAIARWKKVSMTFYVSTMYRLIATLGADYFVAVLISIVLALAFAFGRRWIGITAGLRLSHAFNAVATLYVQFYIAHLLGWAVYRHRDQLEY